MVSGRYARRPGMKAIINGKRFDTEKCVLIGETDNLHKGASSTTDFSYWEAGLYKTPRSGQYFIAGSGGPMSCFGGILDDHSRSGGSGIRPLSKEDALEWAEQHLDADVVEAEFADMIEDA
jgi:hypothetical protein